ncbi:acyl-CoA thioesterase/BAAT N-terminal domain-containing protein [Desulforhopalus vacuolatus]|uniref:acyl-CoA thioester hydrolase/BAAT C-terminal domain-containing protein n=1 Tax=Desulforhopalus vacuolatus TaxID=40414 RepID=UPI0019627671|nr:acyl-CoA thioester hydrolase/BAAT C-terminal domain-containing protein [Desulforhopalus vacuolatus]MBM9519863.1 acyl-CoA thioesterase/BAAT N-terminal domain-containing protein [Desulforhopalus vacuolatus]
MSDKCKIVIQPSESLADQPLMTFKICGLTPNHEVAIRARTQDEAGTTWMSWGTFQSDEAGSIDISKQAPLAGTFAIADPSAILWSMRPDGDTTNPVSMFEKKTVTPLSVKVSVEINEETVAQTTIVRIFSSKGTEVIREPVDQEGVTGTLFYPASKGPHPAVICLSGSGGGFNEPRASLLAAHGYAAFALAYFGAGSLPRELHEIPVEFIERGLSWLGQHNSVDCDRIAVYGYSKGGELALLLGSLYSQIKAVAAFSGSSFVWQGLRFGRPGSSWTQGGKTVPYLPMKVPLYTIFKLFLGKTVAFRESYTRGLRASKNLDTAAIRVEQINGPVFLVAGTDDQVWPAADFADTIAERLKQHEHQYPCKYFREKGAGHLVCMPYLPSAEVCRNLIFTSSNIEITSIVMIKTWDAMIDFFEEFLK